MAYEEYEAEFQSEKRVRDAVDLLKTLTSDERLEAMNRFCKECGDEDPSCQCWNDD